MAHAFSTWLPWTVLLTPDMCSGKKTTPSQVAGEQSEYQSGKREICSPKGPTGTGIHGQCPTRDFTRGLSKYFPMI